MSTPALNEALSPQDAKREVIRDIEKEQGELFRFQNEVKDAFKKWLEANIDKKSYTELFGLIEEFNIALSKSKNVLTQLEEKGKELDLDGDKKVEFEEFLNAMKALLKAFELLRDLEVSDEEIQRELADLKAEILKPLEIKGESLDEVLSEKAKITLEEIVDTREYENFKNKFLALEGVRKFLREEENDLDFDKNERYNIDTDKLVREVVGYMIDLGLISKPEDLQKVFDKMIIVGGVFEYKESGNTKIGKNALFVKVDDKIITIRGNYGTTDRWVFRVGVDKNLKEAASKLGVSPQKLKELLNFDAPYGKIGQEKIGMRVEEGERIDYQKGYYEVKMEGEINSQRLKNIFGDNWNPEQGRYGMFRIEEGEIDILDTDFILKIGEKEQNLLASKEKETILALLGSKKLTLIVGKDGRMTIEVGENMQDGRSVIEIREEVVLDKISYAINISENLRERLGEEFVREHILELGEDGKLLWKVEKDDLPERVEELRDKNVIVILGEGGEIEDVKLESGEGKVIVKEREIKYDIKVEGLGEEFVREHILELGENGELLWKIKKDDLPERVEELKDKNVIVILGEGGKIEDVKLESGEGKVIVKEREIKYDIKVEGLGEEFVREHILELGEDGKLLWKIPNTRVRGGVLPKTVKEIEHKKIDVILGEIGGKMYVKEVLVQDGNGEIEVLKEENQVEFEFKGYKLLKNFDQLPLHVVEQLNQRMEVSSDEKSIYIDGKKVPAGSKIEIFYDKDGNLKFEVKKEELNEDVILFGYREPDKELSTYSIKDSVPVNLREAFKIENNNVVVDITKILKEYNVNPEEIKYKNMNVIGQKAILPLVGELRLMKELGSNRYILEYKDKDYLGKKIDHPLTFVYSDLALSQPDNLEHPVDLKPIELSEPSLEILTQLKSLRDLVEKYGLELARVNNTPAYYMFISSYKHHQWERARDLAETMINHTNISPEDKKAIIKILNSLEGVNLQYGLAYLVKGTLSDEYLYGVNYEGDNLSSEVVEKIGTDSLEIKKREFLKHIKSNWGNEFARILEGVVMSTNPDQINISSEYREIDPTIAISFVYTIRRKENSFSFLPHGLADKLKGTERRVEGEEFKRKLIEKLEDDMLKQILKNYGVDKYLKVDNLNREDLINLFMGKPLEKDGKVIQVENEIIYYLYGDCINPTLGYRINRINIKDSKEGISWDKGGFQIVEEKSLFKRGDYSISSIVFSEDKQIKSEKSQERLGKVEVFADEKIVDKGILLVNEIVNEDDLGYVTIEGRKESLIKIDKLGEIVLVRGVEKGEFNTIDVIPEQGTDWLYAIGPIEYTKDTSKRWRNEPGNVNTRPGEDGEEIDGGDEGQTDDDGDSGSGNTGPGFTPGG